MARRVLVVDDEKLIVKGIRFSLEQDGYEVTCAYDGEEAVQYAKQTEFDIILLDLMLPKLSGLEVCQQIREFSSVPIIMLTAKSEERDELLGPVLLRLLPHGHHDLHEIQQPGHRLQQENPDSQEARRQQSRRLRQQLPLTI